MPKSILMTKQILFCLTCAVIISACDKHNPQQPANNTCNVSETGVENISIFPANNAWNKDISGDEVDPFSSEIIAGIGAASIKADFGSGLWEGAPIGIPYIAVCG